MRLLSLVLAALVVFATTPAWAAKGHKGPAGKAAKKKPGGKAGSAGARKAPAGKAGRGGKKGARGKGVAGAPTTAAPAGPTPEQKAQAKQHFQLAEVAFKGSQYDLALTEYEAAFGAWPLAGFNFNIAQCHRNLGHVAQAIEFFKKYLETPNIKNRPDVEVAVAELEKQQADAAALLTPPPPPPEAPPASPPPAADARPGQNIPPPATETPGSQSVRTPRARQETDSETPPGTVAAPAAVVAPASAATNASTPAAQTPIYKKPWFWVTIAAAVVVVGGAAAIGATASQSPLPQAGSLGLVDWRTP